MVIVYLICLLITLVVSFKFFTRDNVPYDKLTPRGAALGAAVVLAFLNAGFVAFIILAGYYFRTRE